MIIGCPLNLAGVEMRNVALPSDPPTYLARIVGWPINAQVDFPTPLTTKFIARSNGYYLILYTGETNGNEQTITVVSPASAVSSENNNKYEKQRYHQPTYGEIGAYNSGTGTYAVTGITYQTREWMAYSHVSHMLCERLQADDVFELDVAGRGNQWMMAVWFLGDSGVPYRPIPNGLTINLDKSLTTLGCNAVDLPSLSILAPDLLTATYEAMRQRILNVNPTIGVTRRVSASVGVSQQNRKAFLHRCNFRIWRSSTQSLFLGGTLNWRVHSGTTTFDSGIVLIPTDTSSNFVTVDVPANTIPLTENEITIELILPATADLEFEWMPRIDVIL